jgi:hypothetical protein
MFTKYVWAAVFLLASPLAEMSYAKDYSAYGRDIGCAEVAAGRSRQICERIAASLTWQWMGHATIAPGYKPSFEGIRKVYCEMKVGKDDVETLQGLTTYNPKRKWLPDWRLESGAGMLLRIVVNRNGNGNEPENSTRNGCS